MPTTYELLVKADSMEFGSPQWVHVTIETTLWVCRL